MTNPMIRKFVNNWLWDSGGKRKSSGMEWCNSRVEDVAQMITDFWDREEMPNRIKELSEAIISFSAGDIDEREVKEILCKAPGQLDWCDNCEFCESTRVMMVPGEPGSLVDKNYCDLGCWADEI